MADPLSILAAAYKTTTPTTAGKYVAVDPEAYNGSWKGTYANGKKFEISVSQVEGFRAQVKYQSEGTVKFQQVLIKDNSFRVGDTKFQMTANNKATIKNVVTDAATGSTYLDTAFATRST
jgi:hypothetical protein